MSDISYIGYILGLCYDMSLNPTAEGSLIEKKCNLTCSDVEFDGLEEWIQVQWFVECDKVELGKG